MEILTVERDVVVEESPCDPDIDHAEKLGSPAGAAEVP